MQTGIDNMKKEYGNTHDFLKNDSTSMHHQHFVYFSIGDDDKDGYLYDKKQAIEGDRKKY